jgi:aminoglycoside phosphotransferase
MVGGLPSAAQLAWVVATAAPGATVVDVAGLRDRSSPWRVTLSEGPDLVLRVGGDVEVMRAEVAGRRAAAEGGLPVATLLDTALDRTPALLLSVALPGSSRIAEQPDAAHLAALGAAGARVSAVPAPERLPTVDRPVSGVDFGALHAAFPRPLLLAGADAVERLGPPTGPVGFVHGDLWHGNTLWSEDGELTGLLDWDCSGVGPAGLDLGSLRLDAVLCHGPDAADAVLAGWEETAGRAATEVARWDVVAALATPPGMDWFVGAIAGQGRPDLDATVLTDRRDAFLESALDRL